MRSADLWTKIDIQNTKCLLRINMARKKHEYSLLKGLAVSTAGYSLFNDRSHGCDTRPWSNTDDRYVPFYW